MSWLGGRFYPPPVLEKQQSDSNLERLEEHFSPVRGWNRYDDPWRRDVPLRVRIQSYLTFRDRLGHRSRTRIIRARLARLLLDDRDNHVPDNLVPVHDPEDPGIPF